MEPRPNFIQIQGVFNLLYALDEEGYVWRYQTLWSDKGKPSQGWFRMDNFVTGDREKED